MAGSAKALGIELLPLEAAEAGEFERVFSAWIGDKIDGVVMQDVFILDAPKFANLAAEYRLPSIGPVELPTSGGLIGYGVNFADMARRSAAFVDKILKGGKAGDIPIEQATKFDTVINMKTAKMLSVDIPPTLFISANEVIEWVNCEACEGIEGIFPPSWIFPNLIPIRLEISDLVASRQRSAILALDRSRTVLLNVTITESRSD